MITLHLLPWLFCLAFAALGGWLLVDKLLQRRAAGPTTAKTAEMEKVCRRVKRIPTPELGTHLEMATTAAFDAVHSWTRAVDPLQRGALQREATMAVRAQLALLEEQAARGIV